MLSSRRKFLRSTCVTLGAATVSLGAANQNNILANTGADDSTGRNQSEAAKAPESNLSNQPKALAETVDNTFYRLENFRAPAHNGNDSLALTALWVEARETGGTILLPPGDVVFKSPVALNVQNLTKPLKFVGQNGTRVVFDAPGADVLSFGNISHLIFENIIFRGVPGRNRDCARGIIINVADYVIFADCMFIGISADRIIASSAHDNFFTDCHFGGCGGDCSVYSESAKGFTFERTRFVDYGHIDGVFHNKSSDNINRWVHLIGASDGVLVNSQRPVRFIDCGFDEAAPTAIVLNNLQWAEIDGCRFNVYTTINGIPIFCDTVRDLRVRRSWARSFDLKAEQSSVIARLINNGRVEFDSVLRGITNSTIQATSPELVNIIYSDLTVEHIPLLNETQRVKIGFAPPAGWTFEGTIFRTDLSGGNQGAGVAVATNSLGTIENPAPLSLYQTARVAGNAPQQLVWVFEGFNNTKQYVIRLHFATGIAPNGSHTADWLINDEIVLDDFSVTSNGSRNTAFVREFTMSPKNSRFIIKLISVTGWSNGICGIEIYPKN